VEQQQKRQQRDDRVIQSGGTVYAKDGREAVLKRQRQADEKAATAAERAWKRRKTQDNSRIQSTQDPFIHWVPGQN
jgi:hypothetical protein